MAKTAMKIFSAEDRCVGREAEDPATMSDLLCPRMSPLWRPKRRFDLAIRHGRGAGHRRVARRGDDLAAMEA